MNKDSTILYQVAFKGAIEIVKDHIESGTTAGDIAHKVGMLSDALYSELVARINAGHPEMEVAPKASSPPGVSVPQAPIAGGASCPQCGTGVLQFKANKDGTKRWQECSNRKRVKQDDGSYADVGTCTYVVWG